MKYIDLFEKREEYINKTIKFNSTDDLFDELYAQPNMTGRIVDITEEETLHMGFDEVLILKVDWSGFELLNKPFEANDWYVDSNQHPPIMGTMREAGMYPAKGLEEIHVMKTAELHFEFLKGFTASDQAIEEYNSVNSDIHFIEWLAKKAGY